MKLLIPVVTFFTNIFRLQIVNCFQVTRQWNCQNKCNKQKAWNEQIWKLYFHKLNQKEWISKIQIPKYFGNKAYNYKVKKNCHKSALSLFKKIKTNFIKKFTIHKSLLLSVVGLGTQKASTFCVLFNFHIISQKKFVNIFSEAL